MFPLESTATARRFAEGGFVGFIVGEGGAEAFGGAERDRERGRGETRLPRDARVEVVVRRDFRWFEFSVEERAVVPLAVRAGFADGRHRRVVAFLGRERGRPPGFGGAAFRGRFGHNPGALFGRFPRAGRRRVGVEDFPQVEQVGDRPDVDPHAGKPFLERVDRGLEARAERGLARRGVGAGVVRADQDRHEFSFVGDRFLCLFVERADLGAADRAVGLSRFGVFFFDPEEDAFDRAAGAGRPGVFRAVGERLRARLKRLRDRVAERRDFARDRGRSSGRDRCRGRKRGESCEQNDANTRTRHDAASFDRLVPARLHAGRQSTVFSRRSPRRPCPVSPGAAWG